MANNFKDLTTNLKKSIDGDYDEEKSSLDLKLSEDQQVLDEDIITQIEDSYDDDTITVNDPNDLIEPEPSSNINTIRLVKIRSINELSDELDNINRTKVPGILDFKYLQDRRSNEFSKVGSTLNAFKKTTKSNIVLLGSTKNVVLVTPKDVVIIKQ